MGALPVCVSQSGVSMSCQCPDNSLRETCENRRNGTEMRRGPRPETGCGPRRPALLGHLVAPAGDQVADATVGRSRLVADRPGRRSAYAIAATCPTARSFTEPMDRSTFTDPGTCVRAARSDLCTAHAATRSPFVPGGPGITDVSRGSVMRRVAGQLGPERSVSGCRGGRGGCRGRARCHGRDRGPGRGRGRGGPS
jgi:hypothetical protein